jgi:hypothetical protein
MKKYEELAVVNLKVVTSEARDKKRNILIV